MNLDLSSSKPTFVSLSLRVKILPAKSTEHQHTKVTGSSTASMDEYSNLKLKLLTLTLLLAGGISSTIWFVYGANIALNYLLGACVGVVYLRMLARSVDQLGEQKQRLGFSRLILFIILMVITTRWKQLQILPVFLGFLTYKAAILVHIAQDFMPTSRST